LVVVAKTVNGANIKTAAANSAASFLNVTCWIKPDIVVGKKRLEGDSAMAPFQFMLCAAG